MCDDGVRLHVEVSVVLVSSSLFLFIFYFFVNSVQKMCTKRPLPYNNENTDSRFHETAGD